MKCTAWEEQISALGDGELGDQETEALFGHLGGCLECRNFYRRIMQLREDVRNEVAVPLAPVKPEKGTDAPRNVSGRHPAESTYVRIARSVAIAAAVVIMVLSGTTAALIMERGSTEARVIFVVGLPTIEVESTYLPAKNTKL